MTYPARPCLNCEYVMDAYTGLQSETPEAGDVAICIRCGYAHIYNANLTFRHPTAEERERLAFDARVRYVQRTIATKDPIESFEYRSQKRQYKHRHDESKH
jgi:hypothetical protein